MLERIGNLTKDGKYEIINLTSMPPVSRCTFNLGDFINEEIQRDCVEDIIDVYVSPGRTTKVVNLERFTQTAWAKNCGHVVERCPVNET